MMRPSRALICAALLPLVHCASDPSQPADGSGGVAEAGGGTSSGGFSLATGGTNASGSSPADGGLSAVGGSAKGSGGEMVAAGGSALIAGGSGNAVGGTGSTRTPHILLLTKTEGFRHDSIQKGISAAQAIAQDEGWSILASEETTLFTDDGLAEFDALFFLSTTGDILTSLEQAAFERFVSAGGGFIGVHAAADTEPDWHFYTDLLGAHFASHPEIQEASILVETPNHPATVELADPWVRSDEWYNFNQNPREGSVVLLALDETSYEGGTMSGDHPIAWARQVGASRVFYTALGHTEESYEEPEFLGHLRGGIAWVLRDIE